MPLTDLSHLAVTAESSLGRAHQEDAAAVADPFEFDLHRVINCSAFRRLQYKTQVFISPRGDHFRTRLTHTLEVAGMARRLARRLQLNVSLAETIAFAHDLGHPPFGHAGEASLNEVMSGEGGFEHNAQSLRVVEYLEHPFPPFRGLNLTVEVREALARHHTAYDRPAMVDTTDGVLGRLLEGNTQPSLEAQAASIADRLAYDCHDLEDALGAEMVDLCDLEGIELWARCGREFQDRYPDRSVFAIWRYVFERLQHLLVEDAAGEALRRAHREGSTCVEDVRRSGAPLIAFSKDMDAGLSELEGFLKERVYRNARLNRLDDMAGRVIRQLFSAYREEPTRMPRRFSERIDRQSAHRVICDYIAGMTDRFCENEYRRIYLPFVQDPPA